MVGRQVATHARRIGNCSTSSKVRPMGVHAADGVIALECNLKPLAGADMVASGTGESAERSITEERFVALTVRYERRVRVFVSTLHPHPSDVDEILQDAWLVAWKKLSTFRYTDAQPDEEFVRWLCTIARYEVLKYRRTSAAKPLLDDEVLEKLADLQLTEADYFEARHEALMNCLENLRTRDREIIRRRYQEGASARDLAEWINRSVDAVYKTLNRIRASLLTCVDRTLKREGYL